MGQGRAHHLANCYLKAAGVAGVSAEARPDAPIAFDLVLPVTVDQDPRRCMVCAPIAGARRLEQLLRLAQSPRTDLIDARRLLYYVAETNGVGVVAHETVIRRAFEAVRRVERTFADLHHRGELRDLTDEFRRQREAGGAVHYADFLLAKKVAMMATVARAVG